jgi:predicted phosphate transport protein (TIGR00153 family)
MLKLLVNNNKTFYEMFEKAAMNISTGAKALDDFMKSYPKAIEEKAKLIKDIEHAGDMITHQTIEMLNKTFVTPIDREDIHQLVSKLDDILDLMDSAGSRLSLYKVESITPEAKSFGELLIKATTIICEAIKTMRNMQKHPEILKCCVDIHTIENEGDQLLREAMVNLFQTNDPIKVIKWKEIYQNLETATDCCEDVANVIEGIVLKYA